jgi:hypothetical protein
MHVESGPRYLAPHEWDRLGPPPEPGRRYPTTDFPALALDAARRLAEADELYEEFERLEDEASEVEDKANHLQEEADALLDKIRVFIPALAKAIESDAWLFYSIEDVTRTLDNVYPRWRQVFSPSVEETHAPDTVSATAWPDIVSESAWRNLP